MDNNTIYAIYDNVARAIVGMLMLHKHEASAVRMYADVASMPDSQIGKHPQDFDLVRLGHLKDHRVLDPDYAVVLKGSTWAAAHAEVLNEHFTAGNPPLEDHRAAGPHLTQRKR